MDILRINKSVILRHNERNITPPVSKILTSIETAEVSGYCVLENSKGKQAVFKLGVGFKNKWADEVEASELLECLSPYFIIREFDTYYIIDEGTKMCHIKNYPNVKSYLEDYIVRYSGVQLKNAVAELSSLLEKSD